MNEESRLFLADVQSKLNTYFSGEEIETLAFVLGIDYDALRGGTKPTKVNALILDAARKGQIAQLLGWARRERTNVTWPEMCIRDRRCAYPAENVRLLLGREATREGIRGGLAWLKERIAADSSGDATAVFFYLSLIHI